MPEEQMRSVPMMQSQHQTEEDNGFADPAANDMAEIAEQEAQPQPELTFDQKLDKLGYTVTRQPLDRELLYKTLVFCLEERPLNVIEQEMATYPEFASCTTNQYYLITKLVGAYGLELIEKDVDGNVVTPEQKVGLTEDEEDDLVASFHYKTTEVGRAFVEEYSPKARLVQMLQLNPERTETYVDVLEFVHAQPRTYAEIQKLLAGRPALQTVIDGHVETMQPSVFVDKLERAGALVWKEGWTLTEEGVEFLEEMKADE
ncbi:hypothetical protein [Adlercreutzia sp. ZJ141]|uniref:hypothetical protein n=1 Tax=Adlercreutzia sp. ZJ141 TaxID=2709406 RepID=UPI0013E9F0E4|nr:hypothetical protein [Adlercreutzia sp. ZJ141]